MESTECVAERAKDKPNEPDEAATLRIRLRADIVRAILASEPTVVDEASIRQVLGDSSVRTLTEVAQIFGRSYNTVKTSWRPSGMPAESATCFRLADVLIWWLNREVSNRGAQGRTEMAERKRAAETLTAELAAQRQQLALDAMQGKYASVELLRSRWNAGMRVLSSVIMGLPRIIRPALCRKCAENAAAEMERLIHNELTRISQMPADEAQHEGSTKNAAG